MVLIDLDNINLDLKLIWYGMVWYGLVWCGLAWFGSPKSVVHRNMEGERMLSGQIMKGEHNYGR